MKVSRTVTLDGSKREAKGELWFTCAPKNYDGFGTVTLGTIEKDHANIIFDLTIKSDLRLVMVLDDHVGWQSARYSSGMETCFVAPGPVEQGMDGYLHEWIWERIQPNPEGIQ